MRSALALLLAVPVPAAAGAAARTAPAFEGLPGPALLRLAQEQEAPPAPEPEPVPEGPPPICTSLDFSGVAWPQAMSPEDRRALALALSVTGDFEGPNTWGTVSTDFDGQGVSLGLLNQNLGQGSLQPLLLRLREAHPGALEAALGEERAASLAGMLEQWARAFPGWRRPFEPAPSLLDEPAAAASVSPQQRANQASVAWARRTLYRSRNVFVPEWRDGLSALAATPEYVTLQVQASFGLHERALDYHRRLGIGELRSYLLMFDFIVQNGSLSSADFSRTAAWARVNPRSTATQRMERLLEFRLPRVRRRYRANVRARKQAIIRGTGRVHREGRNLPVEFCYDALEAYPAPAPSVAVR